VNVHVLKGEMIRVDFFDKENCDRCKTKLSVRIMSIFNTDTICLHCKRREEAHPLYAKAKQAELEAVLRGDRKFKGIGLPLDLK
jgi:hypothetical protein